MKILIVDEVHACLSEILLSSGFQVDYNPHFSLEEIKNSISEYDGIVVRSKIKIEEKFLEKAPNLKFVARAGAGIDQIDTEILRKKSIALFTASEGNREAVAEHTLALLLNLLNKINIAHAEIQNFEWNREKNRGLELKGKTVSLMGYGVMGKGVAKRLKGFDVTCLAYDKYVKNFSDSYVKESTMEEIYEKTDILSLHIPLTSETRNLVNQSFIHKFKKKILLLNTARGEIVNTKDLVQALEMGNVWAAGLDVLENENLGALSVEQKETFTKLVQFPQVILTPHVAGWTVESYRKISEVLAEKIKNFSRQEL